MTSGAENICLAKEEKRDRRRLLGTLREQWREDTPFAAIFQLRMRCKCNTSPGFGSGFLLRDLYPVPQEESGQEPSDDFDYLATAAHNLFCTKCEKYKNVQMLLSCNPPCEKSARSTHSDGGARNVLASGYCLTEGNTHFGWMQVPKEYRDRGSSSIPDHERYPYDFGVVALRRCRMNEEARQIVDERCRPVMFEIMPSSGNASTNGAPEAYGPAHLVGFPLHVFTSEEEVKPQSHASQPYVFNGTDPPEKHKDYGWQWLVPGALACVPLSIMSPVEITTSLNEEAQRNSAGLFSFPQEHEHTLPNESDELVGKRLLRHYIDTTGGQSGCPAYLVKETRRKRFRIDRDFQAVGIHVGHWGEKKSNCNVVVRLTAVIDIMQAWVKEEKHQGGGDGSESGSIDLDFEEDMTGELASFQEDYIFGGAREPAGEPAMPAILTKSNPWERREFPDLYDKLLDLNKDTFRRYAVTLKLITIPESSFLEEACPGTQKHNEKLLQYARPGGAKSFAKLVAVVGKMGENYESLHGKLLKLLQS